MSENRRENFRASVVQPVAATLLFGHQQMQVQLVEESAGGVTVVSENAPTFQIEDEVNLRMNDGRQILARVKHFTLRGMNVRIGLQRLEMETNNRIDLRREFSTSNKAAVSPFLYAGVLLLGLLVGCAIQLAPVQRYLMTIPVITTVCKNRTTILYCPASHTESFFLSPLRPDHLSEVLLAGHH